jgi:hypothetical protein
MTDWQAGDLALCVRKLEDADSRGKVFLVLQVVPVPGGWLEGEDGPGLILRGVDHTQWCGSWHGNFRRITPDCEIEGIEVERRVPVTAISGRTGRTAPEARSDHPTAAGDI